MWRTTPPPEGMGQLRRLRSDGWNRTTVLGSTPDSLYQIAPSLVLVIP
jgi:hypothetical protein